MGFKKVLKGIGSVAKDIGIGAAEGATEQVAGKPVQSFANPQSVAIEAASGAAKKLLGRRKKAVDPQMSENSPDSAIAKSSK